MKGATALPETRTRTPKRTRTATIGRSHHFLFSFRKAHDSARNPSRAESAAARSTSVGLLSLMNQMECRGAAPSVLPQVPPCFVRRRLGLPVGRTHRLPVPYHGVPTAESQEEGDGQENDEEQNGENDLRHDEPDREGDQ